METKTPDSPLETNDLLKLHIDEVKRRFKAEIDQMPFKDLLKLYEISLIVCGGKYA